MNIGQKITLRATVVDTNDRGDGVHNLTCETPDGTRFSIPSSALAQPKPAKADPKTE